jgi:hypothetical protein
VIHAWLEGEVGVIAPGKLADIVIWNGDPIADITVLQRPSEISAIIKDGRVVDREAGGFRRLPDELPRARSSITLDTAPPFSRWSLPPPWPCRLRAWDARDSRPGGGIAAVLGPLLAIPEVPCTITTIAYSSTNGL